MESQIVEYKEYPHSKNLAFAFYKAGFIESWGRGWKKICDGLDYKVIEDKTSATTPTPTSKIEVFDDYYDPVTWNGSTTLKIFTNSMYQFKDLIAPESSNTYQFIVKNATEYNLKYKISFEEFNKYNINMKFKLKKNDTYLIDHYVSASELNVDEMILNITENDTFYLEWKWISSSNDTSIGKTPDAYYGLTIKVEAESIND